MLFPLLLCGKRGRQALIAALSPDDSSRSRVLYIQELNSLKRFMIDSGADVNDIPPTHADGQRPNICFILQAVNQTNIRTYGQRLLKLNLGLRRSCSHIFIVAAIPNPILGADFFERFNLSVSIAKDALLITRPVYP